MRLLSRREQEVMAGAIAMALAAADAMYLKLKDEPEGEMYADVLTECWWLAAAVGGGAEDFLMRYGAAEQVETLHKMGYGSSDSQMKIAMEICGFDKAKWDSRSALYAAWTDKRKEKA